MLNICSLYPHKLWTTIMFYAPGCLDDFSGGEPWERKGWWSLVPGQCKTVYGGDLEDLNRYWCFYAQASDGAIWTGPYARWVLYTAFDLCGGEGISGPPKKWVGYRLLDIDSNDDFTLYLVP